MNGLYDFSGQLCSFISKLHYSVGRGVAKDMKKALELYHTAADLGDPGVSKVNIIISRLH